MIIEIDYESETPIYLQLRNEIVRGIGSGQFKYGENLPTVRTLANDLQVNTMTVSKAYNLLKQEGYVPIGLTLELFAGSSCCNIDTYIDAKNVCNSIGIPHITLDCKKQFKQWYSRIHNTR